MIKNEDNPFAECKCTNKYEMLPHGKAFALFYGHCIHRHGLNLGYVTEPDMANMGAMLDKANIYRPSKIVAIQRVGLVATDVEFAVAEHFNYRTSLIVPNVSWGWSLRYEADMVVVRESMWAMEIEIKVSAADIKADLKKTYQHDSQRFRMLWFAVPEKLKNDPNINERAGILAVRDDRRVEVIRTPKVNTRAKKITPEQYKKLLELAAMRIWSLKSSLRFSQKRFADVINKKDSEVNTIKNKEKK